MMKDQPALNAAQEFLDEGLSDDQFTDSDDVLAYANKAYELLKDLTVEYRQLRDAARDDHRQERLRIAEAVLGGLLANRGHLSDMHLASVAVDYADALIKKVEP